MHGRGGGLPPAIGHLIRLEQLRMHSLRFTNSTLPDIFSKMSALRRLELHGCRLTGSFPASLIGLEHLRTVDLGDNWLHGPIPDTIRTKKEALDVLIHNAGVTLIPPDLPPPYYDQLRIILSNERNGVAHDVL